WLAKPREELVQLGQEVEVRVKEALRVAREKPAGMAFLPDLRPTFAPPVWRQAVWSADDGITRPNWLPRGAQDADAAIHAALLGVGRNALAQAAKTWKTHEREQLAQDVEAVLADWGDVPGAARVRPGDSRAAVARYLRSEGVSRAAFPTKAEDLERAIDLL